METSDKSFPPPGWDGRGLEFLLNAFPAGQLSEIVGPWSSGAGSLLVALIARVTNAGGQVALVDGGDAFDPPSAVAAGADLSSLLWVKCRGQLRAAFSATDLLARCPGFAMVALDLGEPSLMRRERIPPAHCLRLQRAAEQSSTILVLRVPHSLAGTAAALAVSLRRVQSHWIGTPRPTRFAGLVSHVHIFRSRIRRGESVTEQVVAWEL
jgi:RecA/RadA recombinase